jgi:hypothetical protein
MTAMSTHVCDSLNGYLGKYIRAYIPLLSSNPPPPLHTTRLIPFLHLAQHQPNCWQTPIPSTRQQNCLILGQNFERIFSGPASVGGFFSPSRLATSSSSPSQTLQYNTAAYCPLFTQLSHHTAHSTTPHRHHVRHLGSSCWKFHQGRVGFKVTKPLQALSLARHETLGRHFREAG